MRCNKCGQDYQGNFCPNCGTPAPGNAEMPPKKKKKFHWWYVVIALVIIGAIGSMGGNDEPPAQSPQNAVQEDTQPNQSTEQTESTVSEDSEPDTDSGWSVEQKNAMASAKSYLAYT